MEYEAVQSRRSPHGYAPGQRILLVGEGDFSFARALARLLGTAANLVATCYDTDVRPMMCFSFCFCVGETRARVVFGGQGSAHT